MSIFKDGSNTEIRKVEDPKSRLIIIAGYSQIESVSHPAMVDIKPYEFLMEHFDDQNGTLEAIYGDPLTINKCLMIGVYENKNREIRRKVGVFPYPDTIDDIKDIVKLIGESLGVYINHHDDLKISSGLKSIEFGSNPKNLKGVVVKERDIFLTNLIEAFEGEVKEDFNEQLIRIKEDLLTNAVHLDNTQNAVIGRFLQNYILEKKGLYQIASKFGSDLKQADLRLSTKYLSELNTVLLEFPFKFKFSDFYIRHAFVWISTNLENEKVLMVVSAKYSDGVWDGKTFFTSTVSVSSSESIEKSLKETSKYFYSTPVVSLEDLQTYNEFVRFCIKCLIYIKSSEPDLVPEKGATSSKKNAAKIKKFYKHNNPFDVIKVGYGFHGRHQHVDQTVVKGHFRWQPCGHQLCDVKLIWIDEHTRTFLD